MARHENQRRILLPLGLAAAHQVSHAGRHRVGQYATAYTRSWAVNGRIGQVRLKAEYDQLRQELALLTEEIRIKDARMKRVEAQKRPH